MSSIEKLIEKLVAESIKQEEVTLTADSKKMSQQSIKVFEIYEELKAMGSVGYEKIMPLLKHTNDYVKVNAAYSIIPIYPEEARRVFLEVSKGKGLIAFRAEMILQQLNSEK